jgi:peroxiredoxin
VTGDPEELRGSATASRPGSRSSPIRIFAASCLWALLCLPAPALSAPFADRAPGFSIRTLSGQKLDLDRLRRKGPVLLDFWATWCKPCLSAIPELQAIHKEYASRGLTVLGVSLDGPRNYAKLRPFAARLGITYALAVDEEGLMQERYQVRAMPTSVLVDTAGVVVKVIQGYRPGDGDALRAAVRALLPGPRAVEKQGAADTAATAPADSASGAGKP